MAAMKIVAKEFWTAATRDACCGRMIKQFVDSVSSFFAFYQYDIAQHFYNERMQLACTTGAGGREKYQHQIQSFVHDTEYRV